jgi:hypothetical protein
LKVIVKTQHSFATPPERVATPMSTAVVAFRTI